jgi:hypothetical protein
MDAQVPQAPTVSQLWGLNQAAHTHVPIPDCWFFPHSQEKAQGLLKTLVTLLVKNLPAQPPSHLQALLPPNFPPASHGPYPSNQSLPGRASQAQWDCLGSLLPSDAGLLTLLVGSQSSPTSPGHSQLSVEVPSTFCSHAPIETTSLCLCSSHCRLP